MQAFQQLLTPGRTLSQAAGSSKKKLFETAAELISKDQLSLPATDIFSALVAREKLGSTGLGAGIAIPHCRVANCTHALGCLITLDEGLPFDAPDGAPVDILFVLLVPEEATQEHLDILASLARMLSEREFCQALRTADSSEALYRIAIEYEAN